MKVAVVAGEASGDRQAANLLRQLDELLAPSDSIQAWGIGGGALRNVGCDMIADSSGWGTIGVAESAKQAASLLLAMRNFKREFLRRDPDLLILVDFGAFNIPIARWVKDITGRRKAKTFVNPTTKSNSTCPICYYFPPSSWRRRMTPKSLRNLTEVSDIIFTPFPWSASLLQGVGGNAHFLGHPLLDTVVPTLVQSEFDKTYGLDSSRSVIALLPGSRVHEVQHILPIMLGAAAVIAGRLPGVQFLVACADNLPQTLIENTLKKVQQESGSANLLHLGQQAGDLLKYAKSALKPTGSERVAALATPEGLLLQPKEHERSKKQWITQVSPKTVQSAPVAIVKHATLNAMARADLVIAASGTATLEAAILGKPEIIMYRGSWLMNVEYKLRQKALNITYIGLPNILASAAVCPEFIQEEATVENIANQALDFLLQPERLIQMRTRMKDVISNNLGEAGATKRIASELISFMTSRLQTNSGVSSESGQLT